MSADTLISRLEKVKRTGRGAWLACCPAHEDKTPSLSVRETEDGTVLIHCFAGCGVGDVVAAVGLELDALFPPKPREHSVPQIRRPFPAADVLEAVVAETVIVAVAAANVSSGVELSEEDRARLWLAYDRLHEARRIAIG